MYLLCTMNMPYAYVYTWCERVKPKDKGKRYERKEINRAILVVPQQKGRKKKEK